MNKRENSLDITVAPDVAPEEDASVGFSANEIAAAQPVTAAEKAAETNISSAAADSADTADNSTNPDGSGEGSGAAEGKGALEFSDEVKIIKVGDSREVAVPADRKRAWNFAAMVIFILVAAVFRGISNYCFVSPNNFAVGGISGVAIMIEHMTGINQGIFNLALNVPLLILAFFFLSKRFSLTTLAYTGVYSLTTIVIELIEKATGAVLVYHDDNVAILAAVFGGTLSGLGFVLMMRAGGCQGGTDIIAAIVNKRRPDMAIAWLIFAIDSVVVLSSFFVYKNGLTPILLAIIESFSASVVGNTFLKGMKSAIKAEIITLHCDEISAEIFARLGKGVTVVDSIGQYTGTKRKLLNCVINRRQLGELERIIKKYPDTFAYVMSANEVFGAWSK